MTKNKTKTIKPGHTHVMPWADFIAGRWAPLYYVRPCPEGVSAAANAFPGWVNGSCLPTWAEVVETILAAPSLRAWDWGRWLVARALVVDQALPLAWARASMFVRLDAQIDRWPSVSDDVWAVRGELLRWAAGADIPLTDLHEIEVAADAAADAAAYDAAEATAAYAAAAAANAAAANAANAAANAANAAANAAYDADDAAVYAYAETEAYAIATASDADAAADAAKRIILTAALPLLDQAMATRAKMVMP